MSVMKPKPKPACKRNGEFFCCDLDTNRRQYRDLCPQCFPDGEVPDEVTHFIYTSDAKYLHKSIDQGDAEWEATGGKDGLKATHVLGREDVTTFDQAREILQQERGGDE